MRVVVQRPIEASHLSPRKVRCHCLLPYGGCRLDLTSVHPALPVPAPFSKDDWGFAQSSNTSKMLIPHARKIIWIVGCGHVILIAVPVSVRGEDEAIWDAQHNGPCKMPSYILSPPVVVPFIVFRPLCDNKPAWADTQHLVSEPLHKITPAAPGGAIWLIEQVCNKRRGTSEGKEFVSSQLDVEGSAQPPLLTGHDDVWERAVLLRKLAPSREQNSFRLRGASSSICFQTGGAP